ncbi:MAG: radical SAM protein [Bacteroidales bacterium]|nr:radical SAM protein [Bacteroidales bacterium]
MKDNYPDLEGKAVPEYFKKRIRSAAELKRLMPYREAGQGDLGKSLNSEPHDTGACIYIHVPFCNNSCSFCGYYKCLNPHRGLVDAFTEQVKNDLEYLSGMPWVAKNKFRAVYFGGGTPSSLPSGSFFDMVDLISREFNLSEDCEISFESTISDLDEEYLEGLGKSSVNRVSLGIQSFDDKVRKKNSRISGTDDIRDTIRGLRSAGISNICADLMYNIKGQTVDSWQSDLEMIRKLGLNGASVYPLIPFPGSPMVVKGDYSEAEPADEYRYFAMADQSLLSIPGWKYYTPVQYGHYKTGKAGYVVSQADNADILAIGPGAGGRINEIQYLNTYTVEDYAIPGTFPRRKMKISSMGPAYRAVERKLSLFRKTSEYVDSLEEAYADDHDFLEFLLKNSFIRYAKNEISLTRTGRYWSGNLASLATGHNRQLNV